MLWTKILQNSPYPTLPHPTPPYPILPANLPYPTPLPLPYPTLPYPTLPYPTLPYPTLPYPTLPLPYPTTYPTLPYLFITCEQKLHVKCIQAIEDIPEKIMLPSYYFSSLS